MAKPAEGLLQRRGKGRFIPKVHRALLFLDDATGGVTQDKAGPDDEGHKLNPQEKIQSFLEQHPDQFT